MKKMRAVRMTLTACAVIGVLVVGLGAAQANVITFYSDRASWLVATTGVTTLDFEGLAPDLLFTNYPVPPGVTLGGVHFDVDQSNGIDQLFAAGRGVYYPANSVLSSQSNQLTDPSNLVITLPGAFRALALDLGSLNGSTDTFTLSTGDVFVELAPALMTLGFVGLISTDPITGLRIDQPAGGFALNVDNFSFGSPAAAVPEPSTLMLGVVSLTMLLWAVGGGRNPHASRSSPRASHPFHGVLAPTSASAGQPTNDSLRETRPSPPGRYLAYVAPENGRSRLAQPDTPSQIKS